MGDGSNESFLHVAEVDVEISTAGRSPRLSHVLRKDLARTNSFDENSTKIANQGRQKILRLQCECTADCGRFLAQRAEDSADNFCLPVEVYQTLFHKPGQLQVTIKLEKLLGLESGFSRTTERLAIAEFTWSIFGANAHLKGGTSLPTPAALILIARGSFLLCLVWLLIHHYKLQSDRVKVHRLSGRISF